MATMNSLLFLFSTLAPNLESPGNLPATQVTPEWLEGSVPRYGPNVLSQAAAYTQRTCDVGESLSCRSHCQKNCTNYDQDLKCPDICVLGCVCIDPFIRGSDGSCIRSYECPATPDYLVIDTIDESDDIQCQPDEEVSFFPHCQKNCTNIDQIIVCPGAGPPGCACKSPKIRGPEGNCIRPKECPQVLRSLQDDDDDDDDSDSNMTCPPNEEVSCFSHCQINCTNYNKHFQCPMYCVSGCVCKLPLIRGPDGSCVMPEQCNALQKTSQRSTVPSACLQEKATGLCQAYFTRFYFNKETGNCESFIYGGCKGNSNNFNSKEDCEAVCKGSYCQNSEDCTDDDDEDNENDNEVLNYLTGPFDNFKFCLDENEVYHFCSSQCPDNCENYKDTGRACKLTCSSPKCECKVGFVRGPNGNCIEPDQCPHSENSQCQNSEDCSDNDDKEEKIENAVLSGPFDNLKNCDDENEVFKVCSMQCPDNCENYKETRRLCKFICSWPKCECKEGFLRGPNGNCIEPDQCPHSETSKCQNSEDCNDNDSRSNEKENTVLRGSSDTLKICEDKNEVYKFCSSKCPDNCENYMDTHRKCKFTCSWPKCECKRGFVRGPNGNCIQPDQCWEKGQFQSHSLLVPEHCLFDHIYNKKICQSFDDWNINASHSCLDRGMQLRSSAMLLPCGVDLFSRVAFVCCPKNVSDEVCSENEEYMKCGTACQKNCQNYDKNILCPLICESGCFCKDPMIRGPDGNCIYKEECPAKLSESNQHLPPYLPLYRNTAIPSSVEGCPENEEYKECGTACQKSCQNFEEDIPCVGVCKSGCFCKDPMIRGPDGNCIYKEECPAKLSEPSQRIIWPLLKAETSSSDESCPVNEEYKECGTACQKNCQNYDKNIPCEFKCESGCFCKEPMIRSQSGKCIHKEECPVKSINSIQPRRNFSLRFSSDYPKITGKLFCKENEKFSFCAPLPLCHDDCTNYQRDRLCKRTCMPGCMCIEGYVKGSEGKCIKIEECEEKKTDDCSDLEVYDECGSFCELDCHNHNVTDRKCEDNSCRKGCFCKSGLVRSSDGKCISPDNCPAPNTRSWNKKFLRRGEGRY